MKIALGILAGMIGFLMVVHLINFLFFQKSSMQIAKERCANIQKTMDVFAPDAASATIDVDGKVFTCRELTK
jgi:hypothetical protein